MEGGGGGGGDYKEVTEGKGLEVTDKCCSTPRKTRHAFVRAKKERQKGNKTSALRQKLQGNKKNCCGGGGERGRERERE